MALSDVIDRVKPSVVQIWGVDPSTGERHILGTGFFVGQERRIVTAKHVTDVVTAQNWDLQVALAGPDVDTPQVKVRASFMGGPAAVEAIDDALDLALIDVDPGLLTMRMQVGPQMLEAPARAIPFAGWKLHEGDGIAISGYPLRAPSLVTTTGILASTFAPEELPTGGFTERFLGDITANRGNSGGPVYTAKEGALVGVCVAGKVTEIQGAPGLAQTAGLTIIVPVSEVRGFLEKHGVTLEAPPAPRRR
jgi:S1-C subfamily serine protease